MEYGCGVIFPVCVCVCFFSGTRTSLLISVECCQITKYLINRSIKVIFIYRSMRFIIIYQCSIVLIGGQVKKILTSIGKSHCNAIFISSALEF